MKKFILAFILTPFSVFAQDATEKNAHAWVNTFSQLVATRQWEQARTIAPIGEKHFQNTDVWRTQQFQNTWDVWQKGNAYSSWTAGKDQRSMWKLSEGTEENRPTLGVRKELDGSLWLLFAVLKPLRNGIAHRARSILKSMGVLNGGRFVRPTINPPPRCWE